MRKYFLGAVFLVLILLSATTFLVYTTYATARDGFSIEHHIWDGSNFDSTSINGTVKDIVKTRLHYEASGIEARFFGVKITYPLPAGTTYIPGGTLDLPQSKSADVISEIYDPVARTVTFLLETDGLDNELGSGSLGEIDIVYAINEPSPYPNSTNLVLNGATVDWYTNQELSGLMISLDSDPCTINYSLNDSWTLDESGIASVVVPNDPLTTFIDIAYKVTLEDGLINLKDVDITSVLPNSASLVSSDYTHSLNNNTITWHYDDILVDTDYEINYTLRYAIDRDGDDNDDGVIGGRTRKSTVNIRGNSITSDATGEIDSGIPHNFLVSTAKVDTSFTASTATWGIDLNANSTVEIPLNKAINTLDYQYVIGLTGGDVTLKNTDIEYTVPANASVVSAGSGVYDPDTRKIKWHYDTLNVSNYYWYVTLRYDIDRDQDLNDDGIADGRTRTSDVSITGYPVDAQGNAQGEALTFYPDTDTTTTTFKDMVIEWQASKVTPSSTYTLPNIASDEQSNNIVYTLKVDSTDGKAINHNIPLETVTITDTLPLYASIASYTVVDPDITVDSYAQVGRDVTWVLSTIPVGVEPTITANLTYLLDGDGSNNGIQLGDRPSNVMAFTATTSDGPLNILPANKSDDSVIEFTQQNAPVPVVAVGILGYVKKAYNPASYLSTDESKYPGDINYEKGESLDYTIDFNNITGNDYELTGTSSLGSTQLVMNLADAGLDYSQIVISNSKVNDDASKVDYNLYYKVEELPEVSLGLYSTENVNTVDLTSIVLAGNDSITQLRIEFVEDLPSGFSMNAPIKLSSTIRNDVASYSDVEMSASLIYDYLVYGGSIVDDITLSDTVYFKVVNDTAWVTSFEKNDITNRSSYSTKENIKFRIELETSDKYSTADLLDLAIVDIASSAFDRNSFTWTNQDNWADLNGTIQKPDFQVLEVADAKTKVIWYWDDAYLLPEGEKVTIEYELTLHSYASIGGQSNEIYLLTSSDVAWLSPLSHAADGDDLDADAKTTDYIKGENETIVVRETSSLINTKWVMGELDDEFSKFPSVGITTPGGSADYKIEVLNSGNVPLDNIELIDIFPYKNDTAILTPTTSRKSLWAPYLLKAIDKGRLDIVVDMNNNISSANVSIEYSTSNDPIRTNKNGTGTDGSEYANWDEVVPEDITSIKSIRIKINDFKDSDNNTKYFGAGEKLTLSFKMRAPVRTPYASNPLEVDPALQEAAWGSISMTATKGGQTTYIPRLEPNKVGIIVKGNPKGEIGDFVWFDQNEDGLQNDGYDTQFAGLNGITAILYDSTNTEIDRTITSNDDEGKPGFYLFPNLVVDKYYVAFIVPDKYDVTPIIAGQDAINSDVYYDSDLLLWRTREIDVPDGESQANNYDFGLIKKSSESIEIGVAKVSTGYKKKDSTLVNFGSVEPVNVGEKAQYKVTISNQGTVTLHNILVEDTLDDFTFALSKSMVDLDANLTWIDEKNIRIKVLEAGSSYDFSGEYLIKESDDTASGYDNTVRVLANELTYQAQVDKYVEASSYFDVASLDVNKILTHVKKKGSSNKVEIIDPDEIGVSSGDTVYYEIQVTNTGSTDLNSVTIDDTIDLKKIGVNDRVSQNITVSDIAFIAKGETAKTTGLYTVASNDEDSLINRVSVTADEVRYPETTSHETSLKGLNLFKSIASINGQAPLEIDGVPVAKIGDTIQYEILVKNTSDDKTFNNIVISDTITNGKGTENLALENSLIDTLLPGDSVTINVNYLVSENDIMTSSQGILNSVVIRADDGTTRTAQIFNEVAAVELQKIANRSTYGNVGAVINYTVIVSNKGSIALTDVSVLDPLTGLNELIANLELNEQVRYDTLYTTTQNDVDERHVENTATASSLHIGSLTASKTVYYKRYSPPAQTVILPVEEEVEEEEEVITDIEEVIEDDEPLYSREKFEDGSILIIPNEGVTFVEVTEIPKNGSAGMTDDGNVLYTPAVNGLQDKFSITYTYENSEDELWIIIDEEFIPQGAVLPQTGGELPLVNILLGSSLVLSGLLSMLWKEK